MNYTMTARKMSTGNSCQILKGFGISGIILHFGFHPTRSQQKLNSSAISLSAPEFKAGAAFSYIRVWTECAQGSILGIAIHYFCAILYLQHKLIVF